LKDIDLIGGDRDPGPGLPESVHEMLLCARLAAMGYAVARQRPIDIEFERARTDAAFKIDLLVDAPRLVEIKSIERLAPAHVKQLLTYLRLTGQSIGLLINFGGETLKERIRRLVNNHTLSACSAPLRAQ
jgi:GxxExxY protein